MTARPQVSLMQGDLSDLSRRDPFGRERIGSVSLSPVLRGEAWGEGR